MIENTRKFWTPIWGSHNHFQAFEVIFLKSLGLIYAYSNMNMPLDIQIKKIVAAPSCGRILQLRKNHCAIEFSTGLKSYKTASSILINSRLQGIIVLAKISYHSDILYCCGRGTYAVNMCFLKHVFPLQLVYRHFCRDNVFKLLWDQWLKSIINVF